MDRLPADAGPGRAGSGRRRLIGARATVVAPILRPSLVAAWLIVFLFALHELTMSSLLVRAPQRDPVGRRPQCPAARRSDRIVGAGDAPRRPDLGGRAAAGGPRPAAQDEHRDESVVAVRGRGRSGRPISAAVTIGYDGPAGGRRRSTCGGAGRDGRPARAVGVGQVDDPGSNRGLRPDPARARCGSPAGSSPAPGRHEPPERRDVGVVFQWSALWPHLSAVDTVAYPLRRRGVAGAADARHEALAILDRLGIGGLADAPAG